MARTRPVTPLPDTAKLLVFTSRLSAIAWTSIMVADLPFLACLLLKELIETKTSLSSQIKYEESPLLCYSCILVTLLRKFPGTIQIWKILSSCCHKLLKCLVVTKVFSIKINKSFRSPFTPEITGKPWAPAICWVLVEKMGPAEEWVQAVGRFMLSSWLCGELLAALQGGEAAPSDAEQSLYSQPDLKGRRRTFCDMCVYAFFCVVIFFFFLRQGPEWPWPLILSLPDAGVTGLLWHAWLIGTLCP